MKSRTGLNQEPAGVMREEQRDGRNKPVYKSWLHFQTTNYEVTERPLVELDIPDKT